MNTNTAELSQATGNHAIVPVKLAHFVLVTSRYDELIDWYKAVLGVQEAFRNDHLCFMSYDEEHHRIAIGKVPGVVDKKAADSPGVHHVAFTYASLADLLLTFERLEQQGILPTMRLNHGPTTSLYYTDPDGNHIELQVDNFDTLEEASAFFYSPAFAKNPIGIEFDPADLLRRLRAGEPEATLKRGAWEL